MEYKLNKLRMQISNMDVHALSNFHLVVIFNYFIKLYKILEYFH